MHELTRKNLDFVLGAGPIAAFDDRIIALFDRVSTSILAHPASREFRDLATYGFFIRSRNLKKIKKQYLETQVNLIGRGMAFHVGPANVPLNFAYSMTASLLAGNPTVVRISSRDFEQANILVSLFDHALEALELRNMLSVVQYSRTSEYNQILSAACDIRVIWGGDQTIAAFREFPVRAHAVEVHFANRHSALVVDSRAYLEKYQPVEVAQKFYRDIYPFDQNACTSPKFVFWIGDATENLKAQAAFWSALQDVLVESGYKSDMGVGVRHFKSSAAIAADFDVRQQNAYEHPNLTVLDVSEPAQALMNRACSEGFFLQAQMTDLASLRLYLDHRCQTMSYVGDLREPLLTCIVQQRMRAIDRIVPVGSTAQFSFTWEGKDLIRVMSRSFPT